ncbi:IS1096 element passenger TnpR family protein [Peribacillus cavernae]|nr:hypothetical protein [Peribacillus cavernae]
MLKKQTEAKTFTCPPEDTGGTYGYSMIVNLLEGNSNNEEMDDFKERYGDFDPDEFDIDLINSHLKKVKV